MLTSARRLAWAAARVSRYSQVPRPARLAWNASAAFSSESNSDDKPDQEQPSGMFGRLTTWLKSLDEDNEELQRSVDELKETKVCCGIRGRDMLRMTHR